MHARPFPGKWTANEIIGHLIDSEWVYGYRLRLILCEERPTVLGMDQDLWVAGQHHNDRDPKELLAAFRVLREMNLAVWRRLGPAELAREGQHNQRGPESLDRLLRMFPGHDLCHIDQIERCLEAARGTREVSERESGGRR
jgi:hypothetical protein